MKKLDNKTIEDQLTGLDGWVLTGHAIEKEFRFKDFIEAISAMVEVAFYVEAMNHHPEWTNVYNRLTIRLSTHDAGGITQKDFDLAKKIDELTSR